METQLLANADTKDDIDVLVMRFIFYIRHDKSSLPVVCENELVNVLL